MGLIKTLVVITIRLAWFLTVGWILGSAYFLIGFLMSPFGMLYGAGASNRMETTYKLMTLKPDN